MLLQDLKVKLTEARKSGDKVAMGLLQLIISDISAMTSAKAVVVKEVTEEQIDSLIRRISAKNSETLALIAGKGLPVAEDKLRVENNYLASLLPTVLTVAEIKVALGEIGGQLREAKGDGQATGIAVKFLKGKDLKALGDDVKKVVAEMRQ